jgi:hypothetical protein
MNGCPIINARQFDEAYDKFGDELTWQILGSRRRTEIYLASRIQGTSPRMAMMFACQQAPECRTDSQWMAGNNPFWQEYDAKVTKTVAENCAKNGRPLGRNDDYIPWLAKFPGDPDAVISGHGSPREQIKQAHQKLLEHQERQARKPAVPLREEYIQEKFDDLCGEHPELRRAPPKEKRKIRNQIIRKHAFRGEELQLQE